MAIKTTRSPINARCHEPLSFMFIPQCDPSFFLSRTLKGPKHLASYNIFPRIVTLHCLPPAPFHGF
jgi:hypothetical protein